MADKRCACGGRLTLGLLPDFAHMAVYGTVWVEGEVDVGKGFWESLQTGGGVSLKDRRVFGLDAWRCESCGRVELYAERAPVSGGSPLA